MKRLWAGRGERGWGKGVRGSQPRVLNPLPRGVVRPSCAGSASHAALPTWLTETTFLSASKVSCDSQQGHLTTFCVREPSTVKMSPK